MTLDQPLLPRRRLPRPAPDRVARGIVATTRDLPRRARGLGMRPLVGASDLPGLSSRNVSTRGYHLALVFLAATVFLRTTSPLEIGVARADTGAPGPATLGTSVHPDGAGHTFPDGAGDSFWGVVPAPGDSVRAPLVGSPRPLWEYPLLVPYRTAQAPIRLLAAGAKVSYIYLDESGTLRAIGQLLGPKPVPYGAMVSFKAGGLSGFGGGLTLFHNSFFGPDNRLKVRSTATSTGEKKLTLGTIYGIDHAQTLEVGGGYRLRQNSRFFGLGPESREEDESFFAQEAAWGGLMLSQRLHDQVRLEASGLFSSAGTRRPHEDHDPALVDVFDGTGGRELPVGYGERSQGFSWYLALVRDGTRTTRRPESGGIQRLRFGYFSSRGDEAPSSYSSYRADIEQFVGLWFTKRALCLRGYLNWLDPIRGDIPYQRLLTNDEPDLFRGFRDNRWRDRGLVGTSVEYRWPLWVDNQIDGVGLDMYILADVGQVFREFDRIAARTLQTSYGTGIRVIGRSDFSGRIEFAWSREEFVFRLSSDQIFQYAAGGLFNGRDQSALR